MGAFQRMYSFLSQIFDYGNTAIEKRFIFYRRLLPLLEFGREREGIESAQSDVHDLGIGPALLAQNQQHGFLPSLERLRGELRPQLGQVLAVGQITEDLGKAAAGVHAIGGWTVVA